jgi:hypothetical protein
MRHLSRILEAMSSGLYLAIFAPLIAAAIFTLRAVVASSGSAERPDTSFTGIVSLAIGVATGAYLLGGFPAFIAGLFLPTLRRRLSSLPAAVATGFMAVGIYLATFGSHLLTFPNPMASVLPIAVPAFVGATGAAYLFTRRG